MSAAWSIATPKPSHLERTAHEPRHKDLYTVTIESICQLNPTIRIFKLSSAMRIPFLPGQWLDVYCPDIPKVGGFSITSSPHRALSDADTHLELAIQESPLNPAAAYLWRRADKILNTQLRVRVGGSFTFPPRVTKASGVTRAVFVAGGVGINPIASIVDSIVNKPPFEFEQGRRIEVDVLYGSRVREGGSVHEVLFAERLARWCCENSRANGVSVRLRLFLTGLKQGADRKLELEGAEVAGRRIRHDDVFDAISKGSDQGGKVVYICGPPTMTDEFVGALTRNAVIAPDRIMTEKWW